MYAWQLLSSDSWACSCQALRLDDADELDLLKAVREAATAPQAYTPAPCKLTFDLLTFWQLKVVSESRTCVGYLCASFSLPRPLCSRLRPDVRDRQTSDAHHRLMIPYPKGGGIIGMASVVSNLEFMMFITASWANRVKASRWTGPYRWERV